MNIRLLPPLLTALAFAIPPVIGCTTDAPEESEGESTSGLSAASDDQVSSAYNCAAAGLTTIAGGAAAVSCGYAALPSGGLTALCYVAGAGAAGGGALAYCGSRCPGFRNVCPGYAPESFRVTSRLVSRCVGTARYSHWELTDRSLIEEYGRSRPEFPDGDCACPRGRECPTP